MRIFLLCAVLAISYQLSAFSSVYGSVNACGTDCMKCHTLSTDEVQNILKKTNAPDAKILKVQMSPVRGLWEVSIDNKGQKAIFYIDFSKKYLVNGPIFELNLLSDKVAMLREPKRIDRSRIPLKDALFLGDKKASNKLIVFTDPDCPFCGKFHTEIKKVVAERNDIAFYIKLYPLKIHPDAYWKAESIACSKSLNLLEENFEKKTIPKPNCKTKEIDNNIKLARDLGIAGTPTTIMPDGAMHTGFLEADKLIEIVDSIKKRKGGQ